MFILWSKQEINDRCIFAVKHTLEQIVETFEAVVKENDLSETHLREQELDSFSVYSQDNDFYWFEDTDLVPDEPIYVFRFEEAGGGGDRHHELYFELSNNVEYLLKRATEYFITESRKTSSKHVNAMLAALRTHGSYDIPFGRSYCCNMQMFMFVC